MAQSNFPKGFASGVTVRGLPLLQTHPGKVWWVSNATTMLTGQKSGSNGNKGTFDEPFATVAGALSKVTASRGDIIFVKPGHAESIAAATTLALNVAGVAIVGLGSGSLRPTFTYATGTTDNIPVSAANVSIQNCLFIANFAAVVSAFTLTTAPEFSIENCEFRDVDSTHNFVTCVTTTVTVNADGLNFSNNRVMGLGTTAATTPIKVAGTMDRITINDNYIKLAVVNNTSAVLAHGALVVTNLEMYRNKVFRQNTDTATGGLLITTTSTTNSGMVGYNDVKCLDVAALILVTAGSIYGMTQNFACGDADQSGALLPVVFDNA